MPPAIITIPDITRHTIIRPHLQISKFTNIASVTCGRGGLVRCGPVVKSPLIDPRHPRITELLDSDVRFLLSHWKIAANLQHVTRNIFDPLYEKFGSNLRIFSSYFSPTQVQRITDLKSSHFTGETLMMYLNTNQDNLYPVAGKILDILKGKFTKAELIYNSSSLLRLTVPGPFNLSNTGKSLSNPLVTTFDRITGRLGSGLIAMRGVNTNPFQLEEWAPYLKLAQGIIDLDSKNLLQDFARKIVSMSPEFGKLGSIIGAFTSKGGVGNLTDQLKQLMSQGQVQSALSALSMVGSFAKNVNPAMALDDVLSKVPQVQDIEKLAQAVLPNVVMTDQTKRALNKARQCIQNSKSKGTWESDDY